MTLCSAYFFIFRRNQVEIASFDYPAICTEDYGAFTLPDTDTGADQTHTPVQTQTTVGSVVICRTAQTPTQTQITIEPNGIDV